MKINPVKTAKKAMQRVGLFSGSDKVDLRPTIGDYIGGDSHDSSTVTDALHARLHKGLHGWTGLPPAYLTLLLRTIDQKRSKASTATAHEQELSRSTREHSADALPAARWLSLYDTCFSFGVLSAVLPIRQNAIQSAYNEVRAHPNRRRSLQQALRAAMDQADFSKAEDLLSRIKSLSNNRANVLEYELYYLLQIGRVKDARSLADQMLEHRENSDTFRELVEGKRIAVVGPAPDGQSTGSEIDDHDLIVRINYRGAGRLGDAKEFGRRTDVSYYNGTDSKYLSEQPNAPFLDDLLFAVFKSTSFEFQRNLIAEQRGRNLVPPVSFFNGAPLQGMNVVYDIAHFSPRSIHLYKTNFFFSKSAYTERYRDEHVDVLGNKSSSRYPSRLHQFTQQDLVSQIRFTRNLYDGGIIVPDETCAAVLHMDEEEYLKGIGQIYSR